MSRVGLLILWLAAAPCAWPAELEFAQRPGAALPADLAFADEAGRAVRLRDYFGTVPVIVVLGYFRCPNLCSTLLDGVLEALAQSGLPASGVRLLAVSIDGRETPDAAHEKMQRYRPLLAGGVDAHFLTGAAAASAQLARHIGFPYAWDGEHGQYAHPAGFVVATPDARIARYFLGVRFDARELHLALAEAAAGRTGSFSGRLLLLCAHYDPATGRYSVAAMTFVRAGCALIAFALGAWLWRRRKAVP